MSEYKYTEHDYIITCEDGLGNLIINANVDIRGNLHYSNIIADNAAFFIVAEGNPGPNVPGGFGDMGMLAQTGANTYAGIRFDVGNSTWQLSNNVSFNGDAIPGYAYANILTDVANLANPNIGNATGVSLILDDYLTAGNIHSNSNITANGIVSANIISATSNINAPVGTFSSILGNVIRSNGAISAVGQITGSGVSVVGVVSGLQFIATGDIIGNNISTNGNVVANALFGDGGNISNIPYANLVGAYGNTNVVNLLSNLGGNSISSSGNITASNITANFFIGDGSRLSNINAGNFIGGYGNANVANFLNNFGSNSINTTGTISAGNLYGEGGNISNIQYANVTGAYSNANVSSFLPTYTGNLAGDHISVTSNIVTNGYIFGNGAFLTGISGGGNGNYSNSNVASYLADFGSNVVSTSGNITAGLFIGDGGLLSNINVSNVTGTYGNANVANYLPTYSGDLGNVGIANTLGLLMGTPTQGNLVSNAVTLTTTTPLPDGIALLNSVLGKLIPPGPSNFPAGQTLTISGTSTYRMANIVQVNNSSNSYSVSPGATVTNILRSSTYSTSTIANAGPGDTGTVTSYLNGNTSGVVVLTGSSSGTYGNLIITFNGDYNTINSNIAAGFWYVFSSRLSGTSQPGWNDAIIIDDAAGSTNVPSWYYDNSSPGTPAYTNKTFTLSTSQITYSSTVAHYNSATQWSLGFTVGNISGNTYPVSNTFVTGSAGGAYQAPISVTYNQSNLASNIVPAFASANVTTTSNVVTGFGSSSSGPSVSVNNSYNTGSTSFTPGVTINYKTGTSGTLSFLEETNLFVGGQIGSGVVGAVARIVNPGSTDTPAYTGAEANFNSQTGPLTTTDAAVVANVLSCNTIDYSTGYLPAGPNLSTQSGTQYFTFKFSAASTSKFDIYYTGRVAGIFVALPGSGIDTSSTLNGWIDMTIPYAGAGQPGAGTGGNGSNGCALGTPVPAGTSVTAQRYTCTFGTASSSSSIGNEIYVRIKLTTGQSITSLAIYPASN